MTNLDWNQLRAFHATGAAGSLSAAARRLGLTQPTLSRQVQALESRLGVALFDRPGRRLVLTAAGQELMTHLYVMGEAAEAVALAASGQMQEVGGRVCISTTDSYAVHVMPPILARIRREVPRLAISVKASNAISDLHRLEADIAIRHVPPDRDGLAGEQVGETEAGFYAAQAWVDRHGMPAGPQDLRGEDLIGFEDGDRYAAWLRGIGVEVRGDDMRLGSDSSLAVWEMLRQGMGVTMMLREIAARTPGIVRLLPDMAPVPVPIWVVTHRDLQESPRIRLVRRILAEELARL